MNQRACKCGHDMENMLRNGFKDQHNLFADSVKMHVILSIKDASLNLYLQRKLS